MTTTQGVIVERWTLCPPNKYWVVVVQTEGERCTDVPPRGVPTIPIGREINRPGLTDSK